MIDFEILSDEKLNFSATILSFDHIILMASSIIAPPHPNVLPHKTMRTRVSQNVSVYNRKCFPVDGFLIHTYRNGCTPTARETWRTEDINSASIWTRSNVQERTAEAELRTLMPL
jgi:hypothetical protein